MILNDFKIVNQEGFNKDMQKEVISVAQKALELFDNEKEMGQYIKSELDIKFDGKWWASVGLSILSIAPLHSINTFIYFWIGKCRFLIFLIKSE